MNYLFGEEATQTHCSSPNYLTKTGYLKEKVSGLDIAIWGRIQG